VYDLVTLYLLKYGHMFHMQYLLCSLLLRCFSCYVIYLTANFLNVFQYSVVVSSLLLCHPYTSKCWNLISNYYNWHWPDCVL